MKLSDIEQLASDYRREAVDASGDGTDAVDRLQTLVWYDPESAWQVALRVLQLSDGESAAAIIGAGVLEELLGSYPAEFIPRVVRLVPENVELERAMKYVDVRADEVPREYFDMFAAVCCRSRSHKEAP
jgi:hypothetical protein